MAGSITLSGGSGTRIDWGDLAAVVDSDANFTVEMWLRFTSVVDEYCGGHAHTGSNTGWYVHAPGTSSMLSIWFDDARECQSGLAPSTATWYYVAFSHNATGNSVQAFYATDGDSSVTTGTLTSSVTGPTTSAGNVTVGAPSANANSSIDGNVAFMRVWNTTKDATALNAIFDKHITGDGSGAGLSGLVFNWDEDLDSPGTGVAAADFVDQASTSAAASTVATLTRSALSPTLTTYGAGTAIKTIIGGGIIEFQA